MIHIVKVDWSGKDAAGEDYRLHAAPELVARGLMVNVPTLIQYPNGRIETGNQVKITPSGLAFLKREAPVELREPEGRA
ncbi:hypothetical protein [Sinorhizobium meliloti]|uniref:hypothetical protein n=1 Tax=Rhizobium meliloti TaxID=382 RepID=UPI000FD994DA|nr:hypothetical protein [Sinorhizobium meliloti]RVM15111.1 hypothetical protein CN134_15165 [Sinorhizobium meliloti]RVO28325.1 hypothetical protein CN098_21835 [Sinorhizobium meliloti]